MTQDSASRRQDQFVLRMPDGMRDRLREAAEANNRSMNAEIVARLESGLSGTTQNVDGYLSGFARGAMDSVVEMLAIYIAGGGETKDFIQSMRQGRNNNTKDNELLQSYSDRFTKTTDIMLAAQKRLDRLSQEKKS